MRALLYKIRGAFLSGTLISHYVLNKSFRVNVSLLVGLIPNLIYLAFNLISGIRYASPAFIAVAVYYALHVCIRYTILNSSDKSSERVGEIAACRKGGILLLIADLLITPMLLFGAFAGGAGSYSTAVLIFLASYAAFTLVSAGVGIAKSKKEKALIQRAAYSVRLASSALSVFNLVSALTSSFAYDKAASGTVMLLLGIAVSSFVLYLSLTMIFSHIKNERRI